MKKYLFLFSLLFFNLLQAQELTVRAPGRVELGRRFEVRYEVNAQASDFRGPSFKGLTVLSGPNVSHQQGMSIINGQVSHSVTTGFTYIIQADVEGSFNIGSASCNTGGKTISCQGFSIKVEKGSTAAPQQNGRQNPNARQPQQPASNGNIDSKALFARASISKSNPYQGEQVILTYKIYTQVSINQYQIDKLPGNKGFWSEDLTKDGQVQQYEETVDGRRYMVAEIRRGALFAQESGNLTIEPLDLDVLALVQRSRQRTGSIWDLFDDPFFNPTQAVEKHLRTNTLNLKVKPLPQAPDGYTGAVGNFTVKADVDNHQVRANEAITYRLTVSGAGNLMLIDAPQIDFPKVFEVYDPQINDHINRSAGGISGSRTFEWVLIPRNAGDYTLPAASFTFFDPSAGRYVTRQVEAIPIHIDKGDPKALKNVTSSKSDVQLLNSDINYIQNSTAGLQPQGRRDRAGWWFWTLLCLIVATTAAAILYGRHHQAQMQDVAGMRLRRATKMARKRLQAASTYLNSGDDNRFYEEIYKAIWGCLADKYNIPLAQLSSDTVRDCLSSKQVPDDQQERILQTLQKVDMARFAPGDAASRKQEIYNEALQLIVLI